jgi:hypothetical protein
MPVVPNIKAEAGLQILRTTVAAKLATVNDVFLTKVKAVITLIPPQD